MNDLAITAALLVALLLILGSGVWVGLTLTGVAWMAVTLFSARPAGDAMAVTVWGSSSSWTLTALPLFVWMGEILFRTRLSQDMFKGLAPWVQGLPGRLLHTNVIGCTIFAAVSGSSAATCATIGKMTLPELTRRGYPEHMVIGTLAGASTLGLLIPPSIIMIVYGVAAEVSISKLFIAGVLPGILLACLFSGYIMFWALRNPGQVPAADGQTTFMQKLACSRSLIPGGLADRRGARLHLLGHCNRYRSGGRGRGGLAGALQPAGFHELAHVSRCIDGRHPPVLHDRADPGRGCFPDAGHGLYRAAAPSGRVDRLTGFEQGAAHLCTVGVLHHPGLLSGRHQYGGADHGRAHAHRAGRRHRPHLVWHLCGAGGGDGADHAAGGLSTCLCCRA